MSATTSLPNLRVLTSAEVRALKSCPAVPGRKQRFLNAIVGSMSEEEVAALEERINKVAEREDDSGR